MSRHAAACRPQLPASSLACRVHIWVGPGRRARTRRAPPATAGLRAEEARAANVGVDAWLAKEGCLHAFRWGAVHRLGHLIGEFLADLGVGAAHGDQGVLV